MALLWFVKLLLAVYGFVYQKMYGVVAVAQGSAYCCSQFSKFCTLLDATGSTHFCLCWSVVLRKIGSVMSSSCCYVRGRACVRACACVWVSHLSTFERADRFSPTLWCEHRRATQCRVFFLFFGAFAKLRKTTMSFVMSARLLACLSACNNLAPTGRSFMKFYMWVFFGNLSKKFNSH